MKNRPISAIPYSHVLIMILYALLTVIFLELDNVSGEEITNYLRGLYSFISGVYLR
jgi:hypothetical protein